MTMKRLPLVISFVLLLALASSAWGGLVAWYPFESDANDSSGNELNGIAYGDPVYVPGRFGQAMSFDGVDDYVEIAPFKYAGDAGEFSVTFWFKVQNIADTATNQGFPYLFNHGMTNRSNNVSVYFRSTEGDLRTHTRLMNPAKPADVRGSTGPLFILDVFPGAALVDGQWHMYALTSSAVDGGTVYIDGVVVGSSPGYKGDMLNLTDMIVLGRRGFQNEASRYLGGPDPNDGLIDDVALWDTALSPEAVNRLCVRGVLAPADIIVVSDASTSDVNGVQADQGLADWLIAEGHNVDFRPDYWNELDPNKVAALNGADLIIVSRSATAADYADDVNEAAQWNALEPPVLCLHPDMAGNNRWKWIDSDAAASDANSPLMQVLDPNHAVFAGVTLSSSDPNDPNSPRDLVAVVDPNVGAGITSFVAGVDAGNGALLARAATGDNAWIVEWQKGVEFYPGAEQVAAGRRLLFCAGTQGSDAGAPGAFNLTAEGQDMLRNAIAYLRTKPAEPSEQIAE